MRNFILTLALVASYTSSLFASPDGEALFKNKCGTCHTLTRPSDTSNMLAPPLQGLMYHMSESFSTKQEMIEHINSFVMNPTKEKAICRSVRRFGVMPSQKGLLTTEELNTIAEWMTQTGAKNCETKKP